MIRKIVLPAIVGLWGLALVVTRLGEGPAPSAPTIYQSGQNLGLIFGVLMAVVGIFLTLRGVLERK